ncbi:serine protease [Mesorhizobium sp. AR02]|uniref:S1 family peptidase n=1 Tax=Mesorhizobium sp. AR02 TaxID=2865837 RepID=UPI0021600DDE|nr:serine protease [Mesorhizobium sp. AR02]UVK53320.1 serine protease [Mesorhizobium sp. AR02]
MLYSATRLTTLDAGGLTTGYGTGFFYKIFFDGGAKFSVGIVTNKHVIKGAYALRFQMHLGEDGPSGAVREIGLILDQEAIVFHPTADLCYLVITDLLHRFGQEGLALFYAVLEAKELPTDTEWADFDAIEGVTMVGCPNGLYDEANALPITRTGFTASHPAKLYNGKAEFMVDMACYPGSSGSPIFLFDRGAPHFDKFAGHFKFGNAIRHKLLGILYSGPTITTEGTITLAKQPTFAITSMMHLGTAIRSSELLVIEEALRGKIAAYRSGLSQ